MNAPSRSAVLERIASTRQRHDDIQTQLSDPGMLDLLKRLVRFRIDDAQQMLGAQDATPHGELIRIEHSSMMLDIADSEIDRFKGWIRDYGPTVKAIGG